MIVVLDLFNYLYSEINSDFNKLPKRSINLTILSKNKLCFVNKNDRTGSRQEFGST